MNPMLAALQNSREGQSAPVPPQAPAPVPSQAEPEAQGPQDPMEYLDLLDQKLDKILAMLEPEEAEEPGVPQENPNNGTSDD